MFILLCNAHARFMPFNHTFNSLRMCICAYVQDDWDSDFDEDSSPAPGLASGQSNNGAAGPSLALPSAAAYQARGSTGDISSVGTEEEFRHEIKIH